MNPMNTASVAKPLRTDLAADRLGSAGSTGNAAAPLAFAGLLGEQQQRWSKPGGESTAYDGSAFDVPAARRENSRPTSPQTAPKPREPEATAQAASNPDRPATRPAPAASAQNKAPQKPAEARRDAGPPESAESAKGPAGEAAAGVEPSDGASPARAGGAAGTEEATPGTQALIDWMARWSASAGDPLGAGGAGAVGGAAAAGADPAAAAGQAPAAAATAGAAEALTTAADAAVALAAVGEAGDPARAAAPADTAAAPTVPALQAAAAPLAQADRAGAPIAIATPVESPDFSQALASQLTTLARNGVHEAQLQLNPADLGPISVQITLDGAQAQIDFAATQARTREALEAAWPALAASLHGAGLTLGGGGVSDQRPGARDGGAPSGRDAAGVGAGAGDDGLAEAPRSVRIDAHRGLLDLYA